jgi:hypothetical protein
MKIKTAARLEERAGWMERKRERAQQRMRPQMQMYSDTIEKSGHSINSRIGGGSKKRAASDMEEDEDDVEIEDEVESEEETVAIIPAAKRLSKYTTYSI